MTSNQGLSFLGPGYSILPSFFSLSLPVEIRNFRIQYKKSVLENEKKSR